MAGKKLRRPKLNLVILESSPNLNFRTNASSVRNMNRTSQGGRKDMTSKERISNK